MCVLVFGVGQLVCMMLFVGVLFNIEMIVFDVGSENIVYFLM